MKDSKGMFTLAKFRLIKTNSGAIAKSMWFIWTSVTSQLWCAQNKTWKGVVSAYFQMNSNAVQLKYERNKDQSHLNEPKT